MWDVILETVSASSLALIIGYLTIAAKKQNLWQQAGFKKIYAGFTLLLFGGLLDISDNFPLDQFLILGDTTYEAFFEKAIGYLGGFLLIFFGFLKWLPVLGALETTRQDLHLRAEELEDQIKIRKQAEEKVLMMNLELEQRVFERTQELALINKNLEAFSYTVSHDLRGPLAQISGFAQVLLQDCGNKAEPHAKMCLERMVQATREMTKRIEDLLKFSQELEVHRSLIDLTSLVQEVAADIRLAEPERALEVTIEEGLMVEGDSGLMHTVIENLLGNASKYSRKTSRALICIDSCFIDGEMIVRITDNGIGFAPESAAHIFQPFHRLDSASDFPGTGIGLATVKRIIERHGGRIWATGVPQQGATIFFTMPTLRSRLKQRNM